VTKDAGILEAVSGVGGAYFLTPALFHYTSSGAQAFHIAPSEIALGIKAVWKNGALRASLIEAGLANAAMYNLMEHQHEFSEILADILNRGNA
jgi:hypothetical protein